MKRIAAFLLLGICCVPFLLAQTSQEQRIRNTCEEFFMALNQGDSTKMRTLVHPKLTLHSNTFSKQQNKLVYQSHNEADAEFFLQEIAAIRNEVWMEKIIDWKIQSDEAIANVWASYEFYVNKKMVHSGVNSMQLILQNGSWKIVSILDSRFPAQTDKK